MDSLLEHRALLRCESQYGAIVCLVCNNGFPKTSITRHLTGAHRCLSDVYGPILQSFPLRNLAEDWSKLSRPIDESAPIEGLKIRPGYVCMACGDRTTSDSVIKGHSKCGRQVRRVDLQCWNMNGAPAYWIVIVPSMKSMDAVTNDPFTSQTGTIHCIARFFF
jgi:hypothetical protein